jgi:leucyl-tRNA synthetase
MASRFNPFKADGHWQKVWEEQAVFKAPPASDPRPKSYILEMFPYPSGNIHMGHVRNYTLGDVVARVKRAQGFGVLHPMGWDAFGLPAENAAIERGVHPGEWTRANIAAMREQLRRIGLAYDWSRELATCEPEYYAHEQRFFLEFLKHGIAYRKQAQVNWDPVDMTVLANEQVIEGRGWRSAARWSSGKHAFAMVPAHFRLSPRNCSPGFPNCLEIGPTKCRLMQEKLDRQVAGRVALRLANLVGTHDGIDVFTTRPDTILRRELHRDCGGSSARAVAGGNAPALQDFIAECKKGGTTAAEIETAEKMGFNTGLSVEHPLDKNWHLPVYVANFVLMDYGTGAVFGCPRA